MADIFGTPGDDSGQNSLQGTPQADGYFGFAGDDWLISSDGDDTMDGGAGSDRVFYNFGQGDPAGIVVDFGAGTVTDGYGSTDTLISIEWVFGTDFADTLDGGDVAPADGPYWLFGQGGDDTLTSLDPDRFSDLDGGNGNDSLTNGDGNSFLKPGAGDDTVSGGGGFDTIDYFFESENLDAEDASGIVVTFSNATDGTVTDFAGGTDVFFGIESIRGTKFDDALTGAAGAQDLNGLEGNDSISGSGGNDILVGGQGNDTLDGGAEGDGFGGDRVYYDNDPAGIVANLELGNVTDGWGGTDTLIDIEYIRGSNFDDTLVGAAVESVILEGNDGDDTLDGGGAFDVLLIGGAGNDTLISGVTSEDGYATLEPERGDDVITGSEFFDELSYFFDARNLGATNGITVTFTSEFGGTVTDYDGGTDTFTGIDRVRGTENDDTFIGAEGNQQFRGLGGNDTFDGGEGDRDRVDYSRASEPDGATQGIVANLATGTVTNPFGGTDTLIGIEYIRGSSFDDQITGSDSDQRDELQGQDGNDTIEGGLGDDYFGGGDGIDTAVFAGNASSYTLEIFANSDTLDIEDRRENGTGDDAFDAIELLEFGDGFSFVADDAVDLRQMTGVATLTEEELRELAEVYIAYFDRAPDALGLYFYGNAIANGTSLEQAASTFINSTEYRTAYPDGTTNAEFVETVYNNVIGRGSDQAGFDFWVPVLDDESNGIGRDTFIYEFLQGVQAGSPDEVYLNSKVDIGLYFSAIGGMSDANNANAAMQLYDGSQSSIDAAVAAIDGFYTDALAAETGEFLLQLVGVVDNLFPV